MRLPQIDRKQAAQYSDPACGQPRTTSATYETTPFALMYSTLGRVHPRFTSERVQAARRLAELQLSPGLRAEAESVLARILAGKGREFRLAPVVRGIAYAGLAGGVVGLPLSVISLLMAPRDWPVACWPAIAATMTGVVSLSPFTIPFCLHVSTRSNDELRAVCVISLGRIAGRRALAQISGRIWDRSHAVRAAAVEAITEMLPRLEIDVVPLTPEESAGIARILHRLDPEDAASALTVLQKLGCMSAVPHLRQFAEQADGLVFSSRAAAVADILESRFHEERARGTLLRPVPHACEETLLHTVSDSSLDSCVLLRRPVEDS